MQQAELQKRLEAALEKHKGVGASASIYHEGRQIAAAAGLANNVSGVEMTRDTVAHIGSITKIFNTSLLMQLVDEGRVSLDDPVTRHLPELKLGDPQALAAINLRMLVNHSSGIDGELVAEQGHDQETIAAAIPRFASMGQIHPPGRDCSYCNTATVIAGYLCQKLTGKSWYDLVKERIFKPLQLEHAAALPEDALLHRASVGHFANKETGKNVRTSFAFLPLSFAPAGATLMLSATDLVTFARAHINDGVGPNGARVLSEESARLMRAQTTRYQGPGFSLGFGLGWMLYDDQSFGHGGGGPGILSWLIAHAEKDFCMAVLTNVEHGMSIIQEVLAPYVEPLGLKTYGSDLKTLAKRPEVRVEDPAKVLGQFESCMMVTEVMEHEGGFAMRSKAKQAVYDSSDMDWLPPVPIKFVAQDTFVPASQAGPMPLPTAYRLVNPAEDGRPEHLAGGGRLYKRVAG